MSKKSPRYIQKQERIYLTLNSIISRHENKIGAVVSVNHIMDTYREFNILDSLSSDTKGVNIKLFNRNLFSSENMMSINTYEGDIRDVSMNGFDYIFQPDEFVIHICGIDMNGIFIEAVKELTELGYTVYVYDSLMKSFSSNTIKFLKSSTAQFVNWKKIWREENSQS